MKGKKCLVKLGIILISLFVGVVTSGTPVSAISPSLSIVSTGRDFENGALECQYNVPANIPSGLWYCPATAPRSSGSGWSYLVRIGASNTIDTVAGNYYKGLVIIHSLEEASPILWTINTTDDWILTDLRVISEDTAREEYFLNYASGNGSVTGNSSNFAYSNFYEVVLEAKHDGNYKWSFGFGNDVLWQPTSADLQLDNIVYLSKISEYSPDASAEMNKKDDEDRNNLQNQQGDVDSSAEDSTENMDNATSNITGIVSTFLGNLNNLNRNNCTLPEISAYGFSLGQLNLCTFQPPQWVRTVTSAVVSLIVLSMAVHVFKRIMRIAKGIAGSK